MDENAVSIAMSFASAKLTFINRNSCSILSSVWSDKSYPKSDSGCDYRHLPLVRQRRSSMYVESGAARLCGLVPCKACNSGHRTWAGLPLVHDLAIHDRHYNPGLMNLISINSKDVLIQHHEVSLLANLDRADFIFQVQLVSRIDRKTPYQ